MKNIKIFVSHRIDMEAQTIDNPLYIPVRCGAVFDKRSNPQMLGDDTGDNISVRRLTFSELTVQYWAWKNVDADYYGLCHYRRFLSFSEENYDDSIGGTYSGCVCEQCLSEDTINKHHLMDFKLMESEISKYDITAVKPFNVERINYQNIEQSLLGAPHIYNMDDLNLCWEIVEKNYPHIFPYVKEYLSQQEAYYYTSFVMKKEYFHELCDFEFSVLFELEKKLDTSHYSTYKQRVFGLIGEYLVGIYLCYVQAEKKASINTKQLVYFENVSKDSDLKPAFAFNNNVIVLASSEFFAPYLGVCIQSIIESSSNENNYDIIVLERNISQRSKDLILKAQVDHPNISIRFLNVYAKVADLNFYINGDRLSQETYYGLLTSWFLPNYDKAIVMDCDMVVCHDIANLYAIDINTVLAGVVKDTIFYGYLNDSTTDSLKYYTEELKLNDPYNYFNGGLLYLNMKKFRETFSLEEIRGYINTLRLRIVDQDLFNKLLEGKVVYLDLRWNHPVTEAEWVQRMFFNAPARDQELFNEAKENPYIIHYANVVRPWDYPEMEFGDVFWKYARNSAFYEILIHRLIMNNCHPVEMTKRKKKNPNSLYRRCRRKLKNWFLKPLKQHI